MNKSEQIISFLKHLTVQAMKKQHEAFETDLAAHEDRVEQLAQVAKELE